MKLSSIQKLLVSVLIIPWLIFISGSSQLSEVSQRHVVKYAGLTKTLVNLLKTRTPKIFVIGSYEISMEDLINADIATVFDCDSVISNYMSEAGEGASYEILSEVLKNRISDRFASGDGSLFVNVSSDTTSEGFFINFSIFRDKPVSIPIVLDASDTSFSTSFDTTCTVKFESDIDLFINAGMVNSGFKKEGVNIRINKLSFELTSGSESEGQTDDNDCQDYKTDDSSVYVPKPHKTIPFYLAGKKYSAAARCFSVFAISYWYLTPSDATDFVIDEGQCYTLSYKQLEKGEFKWDNEYLSSLSTSLTMIPAEEQWDSLAFAEKSKRFSYTVDNLFDDDGLEQISLCCDYSVKDGVTVRNKKFVLK
jgi:hypothetical protein